MKQKEENIQGTEKEFIDLFKELTTSRSDWQVWSDLIAVMACTLSNVLDTDEKRNPMAKVEKIKVTREKKKAFTVMELEKIRSSCRNAREHAVIEMLSSTWCRVSELIGIKTIDIHDGKCVVHQSGTCRRQIL